MVTMKTPGVSINEKDAFPNSVVAVATAVPAFIGYTEMAQAGNTSLLNKPVRVTSMAKFEELFGGAPVPEFSLKRYDEDNVPHHYTPDSPMDAAAILPPSVFKVMGPAGLETYAVSQSNTAYCLWAAMKAFYLNGGGTCYVTSIGDYKSEIDGDAMIAAIGGLKKAPETTMIVIPETTRLSRAQAAKVQQQMLMLSADLDKFDKKRFSVLDVHGGYLDEGPVDDPIACFRDDIGANNLKHGAAYYPWLNGAIFTNRDVNFENIALDSRNTLISLLKRFVKLDPKLTPEILKIGMAEVKGDFTISVTVGGTVTLSQNDISAEDDSAPADQLTYQVVGAGDTPDEETAAKLMAQMAGQLKMGGKVVYGGFTQEDITSGKVSFTHIPKADGGADKGTFDLIVTDNEDVQTGKKTIAVVTGGGVLAKGDVQAAKPMPVTLTEAMDADTVTFIGADPVDEVKVTADDKGVIAAQKALETVKAKADAKPADINKAKDAVKKAKDDAVKAATGKTLTVPGVGQWTTEGKVITFTPRTTFAGSEVAVKYMTLSGTKANGPTDLKILVDDVRTPPDGPDPVIEAVDKAMRAQVPLYVDVMNAMARVMNVLPPSAAMVGLYSMVDDTRGVWKAPANVSVNAVTGPMVDIDAEQQENLNVHTTGKSINAIRPFVGEGTLVWGARTLDGNSLDWRYVSVRRTMNFLQESVQRAAKAFVFEPNTANTWVTVKGTIENFLTDVWKQGGLAGTAPADAFLVKVGLGETMEGLDILEGKMKVEVYVCITRPAEFIPITFTQLMQKS